MKTYIESIIRSVFDREELENALESQIIDSLDYDEIAASILSEYDVTEMAAEIAEESPF